MTVRRMRGNVSSRIHEFTPGTRLAFDVNVSNAEIGAYVRNGCIGVLCAQKSESDESWVHRAFMADCDVCLSQDADVGNIIEKEGYEGMRWKWT